MPKRLKRYNHAKTYLRYHIIFSTKYRKKCLEPIKDEINAAIAKAESENDSFQVINTETDRDHIHLLLAIKPSTSISDVVKILKQHTTYTVWQEHRQYMKVFYWSKQHHLWTCGYYAATVGGGNEDVIIRCIEEQGKRFKS